MDKKSKEIIKEAVQDIIKYREEEFNDMMDDSFGVGKNKHIDPLYHNFRTLSKYYKIVIKLNKLFDIEDRIDIEEEKKKFRAKEYISVKEFERIYGISSSSQKGLRARLNNSLPFLQKVDERGNRIPGAKISYDLEEVEKWRENNFR